MNRKQFLKASGMAGSALLLSAYSKPVRPVKKVRIGMITDLHHDIMHDGLERLSAFIEEMNVKQPDFIIQGGDFCVPKKENLPLMDIWNRFQGAKYHVIGNHDTDGGYTREQVVSFWNARGKYYSFDVQGFHFVVLDGNEHNESPDRAKGYARYISRLQLEWLSADLQRTNLPTVVFCHQGLDNDDGGLENGTRMRYALEQARTKTGKPKVVLVLSGHHHQDYHNHINGIHYVQINSASYQWLGDAYQEIRYSAETDRQHPYIRYTAPYKDPLWAFIEIEETGRMTIKGRKTVFVGATPAQLGVKADAFIYPVVPFISDRTLSLSLAK